MFQSSIHELMGEALASLHGFNLSSSSPLEFRELVQLTMKISLQLKDWDASGLIRSTTVLADWSASDFENARHIVLLTIFYNRSVLLANSPLLTSSLKMATSGSKDVSSTILQEIVKSLLKDDFDAASKLHHLISSILLANKSFLRCNAIWWTCNYAGIAETRTSIN